MKIRLLIAVCSVIASCGSNLTETSSLSDDTLRSQKLEIDRGNATLPDIWTYLIGDEKTPRYHGTHYVGSGNFTSIELDRCTVKLSAKRSADGSVSSINVSISAGNGWKSTVDLTRHLAKACEIKTREQNGYQLYCWGGGPRDAWSLVVNRDAGESRYSGSRLFEADRSKCTGITFR